MSHKQNVLESELKYWLAVLRVFRFYRLWLSSLAGLRKDH